MESKKKPGRKRITFTEEQLEEIKHLAGLGVSLSAIADILGASLSTLATRKRDSDKFDTTLKAGKLKAVAEVSNALFDSATGRNGNPPNVSAQIFFLKNRGEGVASWSDVQKIENTFSLGEVIDSARQRIPNTTQTIKRLDDSIDKGKGIFLDHKGTDKNNGSESLSPSKSKSDS